MRILLIALVGLSSLSLSAQEDTLEVRIDDTELEGEAKYIFATAFFEAQRLKSINRPEEALEHFIECHRLNPNDPTVSFEIGSYYLKNGETEKAKSYLESAMFNDPENVWVAEALWELSKLSFDMHAEANALHRLRKLQPDNPEYIWEIGMIYLDRGQSDSALMMMNRIEEIMGFSDIIMEQKVNIYLQQGNFSKAEETFLDAIDKAPGQTELRGRLAEFYTSQGRRKDAMMVYEKIIEINPDDARAHVRVAEDLFLQNNIDSAQSHLRVAMGSTMLDIDTKVRVMSTFLGIVDQRPQLLPFVLEMMDTVIYAHPEDAKGYALKADFLYRFERAEESRALWKKAVTLPNGSIFTVWQQIVQVDAQLGWWDSLEVDANLVIDRFPNQPFGYLYASYAHTQLKEYEEAVEMLEEGELYTYGNPEMNMEFKLQLASAYFRTEDYRSSDAYFEEILGTYPNNPTALNNWAYYLALRKERLPYAKQLIERALGLAPRQANYWDTHAWILFEMNKDEEALTSINRAIEYGGGNSPDIWEHKGDIHGALNQETEAIEAWEKSKELGGETERLDSKINAIR